MADDDAVILPFPGGHEAPETATITVNDESVTVIYLPWRHEVDGEQRPAGVYYRRANEVGFMPHDSATRLDEVLGEVEATLRRHLRAVPAPGEGDDGD